MAKVGKTKKLKFDPSMSCLNLDLDYFDHIKTRRLVSILGDGSELIPLKLWTYCGKYLPEKGEFNGYSETEIEGIFNWKGEKGQAIKALEDAKDEKNIGFLVKTKSGWKIPNWKKKNGHLIAFKERGRIAATERWRKYRNATSMQQALLNGESSNAPTIPSLHNQALPKIDNTPLPPLSDSQKQLLEYIERTEPICQVKDLELFVRRTTSVHAPEIVLKACKAIVVYCAGKPEWAKSRKSWNQTIANWLRRDTQNGENADNVKSLTSHGLKGMPKALSFQEKKIEAIKALDGIK